MQSSDTKYQQEFIDLVQQNEALLFKIVGLYCNNQKDKEDLKQEILYQAWKSFPSFKKESKFSTWFYRVGLNTALNFLKKAKTPVEPIEKAEKQLANNNEPEDRKEQLFLIIKQLNEVDRMLIMLHLDGHKNQEIAEITGMTQNHINVKLHRIKNNIINHFKTKSYV
jgi:RNA polymerase sigma-70 factor (ECF subfamily)